MDKIFLILLVSIFVLGGMNAAGLAQICIDKDPPSSPSNLTLIISGNNIELGWDPATDIPECSGISHYDIYRGFNEGNLTFISNTTTTNYIDVGLSPGTYIYTIYAIDLIGHNEGIGISRGITFGAVSPTGGGGGGGASITSFWECGEWSECINGTQERTCEDINEFESDRTEIRSCIPSFVSLEGEEETPTETEETQPTPPGFFATITGAVTGFVSTGTGMVSLFFVVLIIAGVGVVIFLRRGSLTKLEILKNLKSFLPQDKK